MKKLTYSFIFGFALSLTGCNLGNTGSNSISASTNNNCNPITSNNQCTITLTYSASSNGSAISVNYSPQQYNQFNFSLSSCPAATTSSQTCIVPVAYTSNGSSVNENVSFSINGTTSNNITLSGH